MAIIFTVVCSYSLIVCYLVYLFHKTQQRCPTLQSFNFYHMHQDVKQGAPSHSAKTRPHHVPSTSLHDVLFHSSTGPVWKFAGRYFLDVASPSISDIQRTCVKNVRKDFRYDVLYSSVKGRLKDGLLSDVIFITRTFLSRYQNYFIHEYHIYTFLRNMIHIQLSYSILKSKHFQL